MNTQPLRGLAVKQATTGEHKGLWLVTSRRHSFNGWYDSVEVATPSYHDAQEQMKRLARGADE